VLATPPRNSDMTVGNFGHFYQWLNDEVDKVNIKANEEHDTSLDP